MDVQVVSLVLLPHFGEFYGFSLTAARFLLSLLWMAYAIGQLPDSILADRLGEKRILVISMVTSAVTIFLVVAATSEQILFAVTTLFGLGTALYGVSRFTALWRSIPTTTAPISG